LIIDVHTHIVPEHFPPRAGRRSGEAWPFMDHIRPGEANVMANGRNFRTVTTQCWDVARRTAELPAQGIDAQVLSPMPRLLDYALDVEDGRDLARYLNETISDMMAADPQRFYGLGSVPMQDPDLAARELEGVRRLGLQGVEITTHINGISPGDPRFLPFWREAERLELGVFIHAQDPTFLDRLVGPAYLENAVGCPVENTLAAASIVTSGLLDECPNLRICFSHGAGGFTELLPRLHHLWQWSEPLQKAMKRPPMEYAREMYYDEIFFDNRMVRYLLDMVGTSQVLIGSDYPFMERVQTPEAEFDALRLSPDEREAVGWKNCLRFLGISPESR
jgi:aminocarboxymuconate-semialdehyde decarboxylase